MQQGSRFPEGEFNFPEFDFNKINSRMVLIGLVALAVIWLLTGIYFVGPQEAGVVRRFGEFVRQTESGAHYHLPFPIETVIKPKVKELKRIEVGFRTVRLNPTEYRDIKEQSEMLTGDENIITLDFIVQYRIIDAAKYLFNIKNQPETVMKASEAAIRYVVGKNSIDDILTENKTMIQNETQETLQEILDRYDTGISVNTVKLQDVQPPDEVVDAFKDVASSIQDKDRLINQAEGYKNDIIPKARGEAAKLIKEAEAYREERVKRAEGDISRFLSILTEYNKAKTVTKQRLYIETMESILPGIEKFIIESDGSGGLINILQLKKEGGK
ncbi:MAG: FtsH protease activity modulator HflK [bacterium]|nr:FtsH protease activity modulator HflK [bacterium]